jgi:hypothetical protein
MLAELGERKAVIVLQERQQLTIGVVEFLHSLSIRSSARAT